MPEDKRAAVRRRLLRWYKVQRRDLPWRRSRDPYAIWVSETMLQQTQVKTVLRYYGKFLERFPDVQALARAPLGQVLLLWSGLGYYCRAVNLRRAAQEIVRVHRGRLPEDFDSLRSLPGVGSYTAGAIASIAYGKAYPAIDANARRVLQRLFGARDTPTQNALAAALLRRVNPGDFNQALMELGATICTAKAPRCAECIASSFCAARTESAEAIANVNQQRLRRTVWPIAIVRCRGKILIRRRGSDGLLANLWELPGREREPGETDRTVVQAELNPLRLRRYDIKKLGEFHHAITYRRIRAPLYLCDLTSSHNPRLPTANWRWVAPGKLHAYASSSMTAKALALLSR